MADDTELFELVEEPVDRGHVDVEAVGLDLPCQVLGELGSRPVPGTLEQCPQDETPGRGDTSAPPPELGQHELDGIRLGSLVAPTTASDSCSVAIPPA